MRNLEIESKVTAFKVYAVSNIIYTSHDSNWNTVAAIKELNKIQKELTGQCKNLKIKQNTLCSKYKNKGLKNVDTPLKIKSLKFSWIKGLYGSKFHKWKSIPLFLINT